MPCVVTPDLKNKPPVGDFALKGAVGGGGNHFMGLFGKQ